MKSIALLFSASLLIISLSSSSSIEEKPIAKEDIPEDVRLILDKSCTMCHSSESSNTKGKTKLNFDKLLSMKKSKQIAKISKIAKEVEEAEMPPSKFLAKYPDKGLSEEEKESLITWAKTYVENLAK